MLSLIAVGMATHPTDHRGTIMKARLEAQKILFILFFVCSPPLAQDAKVTPVMSKPLADIQGKEVQTSDDNGRISSRWL